MPAVSKGDGMRGLAVFISDIRNCEFFFSPLYVVPVQRSSASRGLAVSWAGSISRLTALQPTSDMSRNTNSAASQLLFP